MPRIGRAIARTAVVAGTATAVSGKVSQNQANKQAEKEAAETAGAPAPGRPRRVVRGRPRGTHPPAHLPAGGQRLPHG